MPNDASECHFIGPMGSEFWQIKVPPEAVPLMAQKMNWNELGRRVLFDARAGIISWMNPSGPHEGLAAATDKIVLAAEEFISGRVTDMRGMRWKEPHEPDNVGVEADASFYIGAKAKEWYLIAQTKGDKALEEYEIYTPPDLVVEVEVTHLDKGKPDRYAGLGVREMWQTTRRQISGSVQIEVILLDLQAQDGPKRIDNSIVLPGLNSANLNKIYHVARYGTTDELRTLLDVEMVASNPVKNT
ncbi:MAG: hypothetical protein OXC02_10170 [Rhodobacteraceae bacterium]|nr:hypothetical protein [Paracoccaceae bacterium]